MTTEDGAPARLFTGLAFNTAFCSAVVREDHRMNWCGFVKLGKVVDKCTPGFFKFEDFLNKSTFTSGFLKFGEFLDKSTFIPAFFKSGEFPDNFPPGFFEFGEVLDKFAAGFFKFREVPPGFVRRGEVSSDKFTSGGFNC